MDLIERLNAALDETERIAREAACANPGGAALEWSAEKIEDRDEFGIARKSWAIVPRLVKGVVLALCRIDILPKVSAHIVHNDPDSVLRQVVARRKILDMHVIYDTYPPGDFWKTGAHLCEICTPERDGDRIHDDGPACATVLALAAAYRIEP